MFLESSIIFVSDRQVHDVLVAKFLEESGPNDSFRTGYSKKMLLGHFILEAPSYDSRLRVS